MKVRTGLTIPFRTLLNIDSQLAYSDPAACIAVLKAVAADHAASGGVELNVAAQVTQTMGKYVSLDADYPTWFSSPLLVGRIDDSARGAFTGECGLGAVEVVDADLFIFDNTVSVVQLELLIDFAALPPSWGPVEFETWLSEMSSALVDQVQVAVLTPILRALDRSERQVIGGRKQRLTEAPAESLLFSDLPRQAFPAWDPSRPSWLWTNRTFVVPTGRTPVLLTQLLRLKQVRAAGIASTAGACIHVGTNIVPDDETLRTLQVVNRAAQYFYCLLDALNDAQQTVYRRLSTARSARDLTGEVARIDQIETMIALVRNESADHALKTQGMRQTLLRDLYKAFGAHDLFQILQDRGAFLDRRLGWALQAKRVAQDTVVQALLFFVGATQIVALVISFFAYANETKWKPPQSGHGVLDVIATLPFNTVMNALGVAILAGVVVAIFWRRRRER